MAKPLLSEVLSRVTPTCHGLSWLDRLPASVSDEVHDVRRQYQSGALGDVNATSLARALTKSLEDRGFTMPQYKQVQRWLRDSLTK